jgi:hypothetical protein
MKPSQLVNTLLGGEHWVEQILGEASIHKPRGGQVWVASFTASSGGQQWKSTQTKDPAAALAIAQALEAAAREERTQKDATGKKHRRHLGQAAGAGLTQREVALILGLSERAVRAIEKRALRKLARHPELAQLWREYAGDELSEGDGWLSDTEKQALLGLARNPAELNALRKVLRLMSR